MIKIFRNRKTKINNKNLMMRLNIKNYHQNKTSCNNNYRNKSNPQKNNSIKTINNNYNKHN